MTLDEFLGALVRLDCNPRQKAPGQWQARCPAHDDRRPSLIVTDGGERVEWRVHCFTGCTFTDIIGAVDGGRKSLPEYERPVPEPLPSESSLNFAREALTPAVGSAVTLAKGWTYSTLRAFGIGYADKRLVIPAYERGELANVYRYSPTGDGVKKIGLKHRPGVLFHSSVLSTLPASVPLWIVEGEPDVLSAYELGVWAVGVPGVNTWQQRYAERFKGRNVVVCMDCDSPGREAAYRVFADLVPTAAHVRHVDLWPEREDGYDLTDFLTDARKRGDLQAARSVLRYWQDR